MLSFRVCQRGKAIMSESTEIYLELKLSIEYEVTGKHMAATRRDPAEEPELEVTSVKLGNTEIMHELPESEVDKYGRKIPSALSIIRDHCWEHAQERIIDEQSAKEDYLFQQYKDRRMGL